MKIQKLRATALVVTGCILGFAAGTAQADITIERTTSVEGVGAMAIANMSGTSKISIAGDKSRTDSDMKMQSKIVGFLARNAVGPSAEIVLLDQDKLYHLNMNKKEYTETTFEQIRAQMQKMSDQMNSSQDKKQPSAVDQSKCRVAAGQGRRHQERRESAIRGLRCATRDCHRHSTLPGQGNGSDMRGRIGFGSVDFRRLCAKQRSPKILRVPTLQRWALTRRTRKTCPREPRPCSASTKASGRKSRPKCRT